MRSIGRALLYPAPDEVDFRRGQSATGFGRRHHVVRVGGRDAADHLAVRDVTGDDRARAFAGFDGFVAEVEPELRPARTFIPSMTTETLAGDDRSELGTEIDGFGGR